MSPSEAGSSTASRDGFDPNRLLIAALLTGSAVAMGAWHAHGLVDTLASLGMPEDLVPKRLEQFETGVKYQLYHGLAILALAMQSRSSRSRALSIAVLLLAIGTLIFSGSLYVLVLANKPIMGAITPIGGVAQLAGWVLIAIAAIARKKSVS